MNKTPIAIIVGAVIVAAAAIASPFAYDAYKEANPKSGTFEHVAFQGCKTDMMFTKNGGFNAWSADDRAKCVRWARSRAGG
jgi:hypothetical protein